MFVFADQMDWQEMEELDRLKVGSIIRSADGASTAFRVLLVIDQPLSQVGELKGLHDSRAPVPEPNEKAPVRWCFADPAGTIVVICRPEFGRLSPRRDLNRQPIRLLFRILAHFQFDR